MNPPPGLPLPHALHLRPRGLPARRASSSPTTAAATPRPAPTGPNFHRRPSSPRRPAKMPIEGGLPACRRPSSQIKGRLHEKHAQAYCAFAGVRRCRERQRHGPEPSAHRARRGSRRARSDAGAHLCRAHRLLVDLRQAVRHRREAERRAAARHRPRDLGRRPDRHHQAALGREVPRRRGLRRGRRQVQPRAPPQHEGLVPQARDRLDRRRSRSSIPRPSS